jgi:hypothetical protein
MKKTRIGIGVALLTAMLVLAGCGEVGEFILDDQWDLQEIQTDTTIDVNLDDYIQIVFDSENDQATITTGDDWTTVVPELVIGGETFDYNVQTADNQIEFSQGGEIIHLVTYTLDDAYDTMIWEGWQYVEGANDDTIVGDTATIQSMTFDRIE